MRTCNFLRATEYMYMLQCVYGTPVRQFRPTVHLSVRPSVTLVDFIKTAEYIIEILSLSDRPMILVFVTKGCCVNLTVSPLTGTPNTMGVAIFNQYVALWLCLGNGNR